MRWTLSGGAGAVQEIPEASGTRAIVLTGTGSDSNYWQSDTLPFEGSAVYRLRFRGRRLDATGGVGMSGPVFCNRDLGSLRPDAWKDYTSFFMTPEVVTPSNGWLRFGQWNALGTIAFDDVEILRAVPIHSREQGVELGDGERIAGSKYLYISPLSSTISNYSRPVARHACGFNTNRWVFSGESHLVYHHTLSGRGQTESSISVSIINRSSGRLSVSVSRNGVDWQVIGERSENGRFTTGVPGNLLPAPSLWVMLQAAPNEPGGPCELHVDSYEYAATIDGAPLQARGSTRFLVVRQVDPGFQVTADSVGEAAPDSGLAFTGSAVTADGKPIQVPFAISAKRGDVETTLESGHVMLNSDGGRIFLPYSLPGYGPADLRLTFGNSPGYVAEWTISMPILYSAEYGELLPESNGLVGLWWASSGWKVSQTRPLPTRAGDAATLRAASNETEALQIVLRPSIDLTGLTALPNDLRADDGAVLPAENIGVLRVRYVHVSRPTDMTGAPGLWPDPLPPFHAPISIPANTNQPLWVRVRVPKGTTAGTYVGSIGLSADGYRAEVPLRVVVSGFELPDRMTCVSAFGFSPGEVFRYQKLTEPAHQRIVIDHYLTNFSEHHISPYNPAPLDSFTVQWPSTDDPTKLIPTIDWSDWDKAMARAIDTYHFNSFQLPSPGMGGGTFHSRVEPELLGFKEGHPAYQAAFKHYYRAVQEHLRERGWLDEAYVYWFDEPDPKDYDFVMNGFRKLRDAAPDITRMLTEQVESGLVGGPNLWCPISNDYNHEAAELRRASGEKFWWYVCTGPKAPYATEFIDHPATELRVWLWQTWQRKIDGILIWATNYWTSEEAYPDFPQNPYEDPMSWQTSYGIPKGTMAPWGNGDGRFLYPPESAATGRQESAVLEGPVDSIRWEMLRDGIEDYEYMFILSRLIQEQTGSADSNLIAACERLLVVPESITSGMTAFTAEPEPIEVHRQKVAEAIETLLEVPGNE
ncbi:MAG: hypothetical protein AMXMBFR84_45070 [Candidatus Hydrogenedentota bacterium]